MTLAQQQSYYDLGSYHRSINTESPTAQKWFDQGLIWSYGFNHREAARCFEAAVTNDPRCVMAYWGIAFACGPNYNKPWELFDSDDLKRSLDKIHTAVEKAEACSATPFEQALIKAIKVRSPRNASEKNYAACNDAYAEAMKPVYHGFPEDLDVAALYADALMNRCAWNLWDLHTGQPTPHASTLEVKEVLERALDSGGQRHPGILHMYIHLMEMSPTPEAAIPAANCLRDNLVPDSGHLHHMPSHLDVLVGDWQSSIAANTAATRADEKYRLADPSNTTDFYIFYRLHDYHSLIYAAMFAGRRFVALDAVERMEQSIPESLLRIESPPMADWLETFLTVRVHVLIRFGRWDDIIALPLPADQALYCMTTAMLHYGKGIAFAATARVAEAEAQRELFFAAAKRVPPSRMDFPNKCVDVLAVAAEMLDGELEYRRGNFETAFKKLEDGIAREDALVYSEPPAWMQPIRHALGALSLEQGNVERAEAAYKADLGLSDALPRARQHPRNIWALHGYRECLVRLGREEETRAIGKQLEEVSAGADIKVEASCFCRGGRIVL
ncbi:Tetratricopeptide repeat domain protein [Lasiodiplodia theobromae]|uniref:Tetratricopeptide repeat domain protein n=1 Tax=Lasiodiplodia theobromae TaxID=45133 RepID=UPI0015C391D7|nr:Tetratricopeptide repeat domain protein [Lasiodiplodia theobromae]KAF4541611.1 Tetratricopeptide repeat domain protein [Lasiodiplodia theobromae]